MARPEGVTRARPGGVAARLSLARGDVAWAPALVAVFTVIGLALRLVVVQDGLFGDELFLFRIVHDHGLGHVLHVVRETEKTPPLGFLLVWLTTKLGDSELWFRLPSLVFGTALIPVVYLLGTRTVGRTAGVIAAAILALDPFAIFYASEARAYAGLAFLSALSTLTLLWALERGERRSWVAYGLTVLALVYTHYAGVPVLVVQAGWALWVRRDRVRELLLVHGLAVVGFLPWLPSYLVQQSHSDKEARGLAAIAPPSVERFLKINAQVLFGHPGVSLHELPGRLPAALFLAVIAAGLVAAGLRARRRGMDVRLSSPPALLALLAATTPACIALYSLVRPHMSFMLPRNWSPSLPAIVLLVGWLMAALWRLAAVAAVAIVVGVLIVGAGGALDRDHRRPSYNEVAGFIDARARPGDPVVYQTIFFQGPVPDVLRAYFDHPHPIFSNVGGDAGAWQLGRAGARVFTVLPTPGAFARIKRLGRIGGPGNRFMVVAQHRYRGLIPILVGEYVFRPTHRR